MADYKRLTPFILRWEGGYVDDPDDAGGATNRGVTIGTYTAYCERRGLPKPSKADVRRMPMAHWEEIFKTMYWDRWQADRIKSQSVANICVDWVWASGAWGIRRVQRLLGVREDGIVGEVTLASLNARDPRRLFAEIRADRYAFVEEIIRRRSQNAKFRKGWLRRINDIKYED